MLRLVYPADGHQTFESATFVMGETSPKVLPLTLNGETIPVSSEGFFSYPVRLSRGENRLKLSAGQETRTITVVRIPELLVESALGLGVVPEACQPQGTCILMPTDCLSLRVVAPAGLTIEASIPGVQEQPVRLENPTGRYDAEQVAVFAELHWTQRRLRAENVYRGVLVIPEGCPNVSEATVRLTLSRPGSSERRTLSLPNLTLSVWTQPRAGRVLTERAILRAEPEVGSRLTPQLQGTRLVVNGRMGDWWRVALAPHVHGWMNAADCQMSDAHQSLPQALPVQTARLVPVSETVQRLEIPLASARPVQIEAWPERLTLSLHQVLHRCDFVHHRTDRHAVVLDALPALVGDGGMRFDVLLDKGFSGYDYRFVSDSGLFQLDLRQLPTDWRQTRILIDPGHGGDETGATGLDGIPEKSHNLTLSVALEQALKGLGFSNVLLTRRQDEDASLEARQTMARESQAHLVLSIHHNALPDGRDPREARGVSTYYYHPFARPLARHLLTALTTEPDASPLGLPSYGVLFDSLAMTRIHTGMAVLLEMGFFTHPDDYARLRQPAFQQLAAQRIAEGVQAFLRERQGLS
jgi:N-acetylmuramoyl-L-alanine amidase